VGRVVLRLQSGVSLKPVFRLSAMVDRHKECPVVCSSIARGGRVTPVLAVSAEGGGKPLLAGLGYSVVMLLPALGLGSPRIGSFGGAPLEDFVDLVENMEVVGAEVAVGVHTIKFVVHFVFGAGSRVVVRRIEPADARGTEGVEEIVIPPFAFALNHGQREEIGGPGENVFTSGRKPQAVLGDFRLDHEHLKRVDDELPSETEKTICVERLKEVGNLPRIEKAPVVPARLRCFARLVEPPVEVVAQSGNDLARFVGILGFHRNSSTVS